MCPIKTVNIFVRSYDVPIIRKKIYIRKELRCPNKKSKYIRKELRCPNNLVKCIRKKLRCPNS